MMSALLPREDVRTAPPFLPPTIFFFVGFNFIVLTTNLLVADYAVAVNDFMLATLAALVVGKAVITANAMPFLKELGAQRAHPARTGTGLRPSKVQFSCVTFTPCGCSLLM